MSVPFHAFERRDAVVAALADDIAHTLVEAVAARGEALFFATGGTTPVPLYEALSTRDLPWNRITVLVSDARWLPEGDPGSNDGMIRGALLQGPAAAARLLTFFGAEPTPEAALPRLLTMIDPLPLADVNLLGMGDDGHIASLFPGSEPLKTGFDPDGAVNLVALHAPRASATPFRLSLTVSRLLRARAIRLFFFGAAKRAVFEAAMLPGSVEALPVRAVLHQDQAPVAVFWAP